MKTVQWYPGHMAKAMKMLEQNISLVDAVLFVLDARAPVSSYNPCLKRIVRDKPVLFVFNKSDLCDCGAEHIADLLNDRGNATVFLNAVAGQARPLMAAMRFITRQKAERLQERGQSRPIRFLVAGIPNTGKSSLINLISGGKKAVTGDKAGVTRNKQWVKCGDIELLDSPGLMPPSLENQTFAKRLAALGCINDDILAMDEIALFLLEELSKRYPESLRERYAIEGGTPLEMLNTLCKRRGFIIKGGEYDYERGERALIDDFRKGRLGCMTLDVPDDAEGIF